MTVDEPSRTGWSLEGVAETAARWANHPATPWILFLLAFALSGLAASLGGIRGDDSDGIYLAMARSFLAGQGWSHASPYGREYSWLPIGMSLLYALFLVTIGSVGWPLRLFFVFLSALSAPAFFALARRMLKPGYALIAAGIFVFYIPHAFWSSRINPHAWGLSVSVIAAWLLIRSWKGPSWAGLLGAGVLWGTVSLMRGEWSLAIGVLAVGTWLALGRQGTAWRAAAVLVTGWTLVLAPVVIRNYRLHHAFVLISTNYADNMWYAYNPRYHFTGDAYPFPPDLEARLQQEPNEAVRARIIAADARRYMREHPGRTVKTVIGNFLNFWRPWLSFDAVSPRQNILYVAFYLPLFLLFLLGLKYVPYRDPAWLTIVGLLVYKSLIHLPFYVTVLQREGVAWVMMLIAAAALQGKAQGEKASHVQG